MRTIAPTTTTTITPLPAPPGPYYRPTETEALGDAIAELSARIQAATYELLVMIHRFDDRGGWAPGWTSCAHWQVAPFAIAPAFGC